ncbi:hypothetical protein DOTSEDRAFT_135562 [Dothistroma septosporum NZE10]|uniref:Uncharacterized protein n=1 Tax=Dothistroma septosporum (strain NZE10 / CBS 128990) TaxID=675120 RepID=N1PHL8_DOTSN|nr:hypothetical protein DOTSEDRAFT_135562 [Dothistroma septosporum NZE10]
MADVDDTRDATELEHDEDIEDGATPAGDDDEEDDDDEPRITSIPRRKGRGGRARPRQSKGRDVDGTPEPGMDDGSESGTPMRRRKGRPGAERGTGRGRGGFRGRRKGQAPDAPTHVTDKDGSVYEVQNDEALVDQDDEGDEKVDNFGILKGGREYRVRTFTIMGKGERLYMLSTEPARCCGFRDSYLFFTKHPKLYKVLVGEEEKKDLIERGILPNSYKGRNIGVVAARSVFREFGAKIIVGGRKVADDYRVADARANGETEGELVDPDDHVPDDQSQYNRNRYVAWFGASEVYRQQGVSTVPGAKPQIRKHRNNITVQNWQFMHAREASRFNSAAAQLRKANLDGVYDNNTNMMFYPKIMQPTHAKWEHIPAGTQPADTKQLTNGHLPNGSSSEHDSVISADNQPSDTIFSDVPPLVSRTFTVIDTTYSAPPISNVGYPGPDGHVEDPTSGPNGLSTIPQDLIDELPPDCRVAFEEAKATELGWKQQWGTEAHCGQRGQLKIGFVGYPV